MPGPHRTEWTPLSTESPRYPGLNCPLKTSDAMSDWTQFNDNLEIYTNTYIDEYGDFRHINHHGVMFYRLLRGEVAVKSPWPGYASDRLYFGYVCGDANEFIKDLALEHTGQIDRVTPETLQKLFYSGKAELTCEINKDFMEFIFSPKGLIAIEGYNDRQHRVRFALKEPADYIAYTDKYFKAKWKT